MVITVPVLAKILGKSRQTIRNMIGNGEIEATKIGRDYYINTEQFGSLINFDDVKEHVQDAYGSQETKS